MRFWIGALALSLLPAACSGSGRVVELRAGSLEIGVDGRGAIVSFRDAAGGKEYLPPDWHPPLLTLRVGDRDLVPVSATFQAADSLLVLTYEDGLEARVGVRARGTHATLELTWVSDLRGVELVIWGPYPSIIGESIGETVGVVRGADFAMGLQALNPKTLGGYPWNQNDAMPQLDLLESGDYSDLSEEGKRYVLYRVEAAKPDSVGSTLQACTRDRSRERVIPNWGQERYVAPRFDDGGVIGSKIALFGCAPGEALATLGAIEVAEGLPHPTLDGEWAKQARSASAAYLILPFSQATLERAVDVTLEAGLRYLYHPEPFRTWGHFELGDDFPDGVEGLRAAVRKAEARGVHLGVHTLSNFVTTNDRYVTPVPDPGLARVGSTVLTEAVGPSDTRVAIADPGFFNQLASDNLRAAVVGEEILRYGAVSENPPWALVDVARGAFGTRATVHAAGDTLGKLADHAYRVFLTDAALGREMATALAELFNRTGLRQISFDGLEGNRSTGMGNYGEVLFTSAWYDALDEGIRSHFIADASRTSHYFWHIYTRMNWGEPWYAGFRESQTEYRLKNQAYFRRNLMPGMLGWFRMQPETSVEDIEWMLARSAAFDAGYGLVTSFEALDGNGRAGEILALIGRWEEARMAGAFTPEQKARMEDIGSEFHLDEAGEGGWTLTPVHSILLRYQGRERQPGEPSHETFSVSNPEGGQPLRFILTAMGGAARQVRLELDGAHGVVIEAGLRDGESLVYDGGDSATLYSGRWKMLGTVPMDTARLRLGPGEHRLLLDADLQDGEGAHLKMELRIRGEPEPVPRSMGKG